MTIIETKTPPSKDKITRRQMLRNIAASSATALAAPAFQYPASAAEIPTAEAASDELLALIADHRRAWATLEASVNAADSMHPSYGGVEAESIRNVNNDAECEALDLVLTCPIRSLADARAKAAHLLEQDTWLSEDHVTDLLGSLAEGYSAPLPDGRAVSAKLTESSDPLFGALSRLQTADRRSLQIYEKFDEAKAAAKAVHGRRPDELIAWRNYSHIGVSEIGDRKELFLRQGADPVVIEREYQEAKLRIQEKQRQAKAWDRRVGVASLRAENDRARSEYWRAAEAFSRTVPTTLRGAEAMLRYANKQLVWSDDAWMHRAVCTAAKGLRRLVRARAVA